MLSLRLLRKGRVQAAQQAELCFCHAVVFHAVLTVFLKIHVAVQLIDGFIIQPQRFLQSLLTVSIGALRDALIGAYDITADELLAGTDTAKTESKTAQAQMLILELLADGKRMPSAELEKAVNERGISSRTMRTAKSRIGDRLVTEKDGTAWVCYLRD